jgi:hypothetical protein
MQTNIKNGCVFVTLTIMGLIIFLNIIKEANTKNIMIPISEIMLQI